MLIDSIFLGINPCGETRDFASDSVAWFQVQAEDRACRFATLSDDASFILIDDHPLVAWGGWHGLDGGRRGEQGASCELAPGVHKLEYLYVQNGDNPIQEVAWSTPGRAQPAVMTPEDFLRLSRWDARPALEVPWVSWSVARSSRAGGACLTMVRLEAHGAGAEQAVWRFDDGGAASGRVVEHAFARVGMRALEMTPGFPQAVALQRRISVHPCWTQVEEWSESVQKEARAQLAERDPLSHALPWQDDLALLDDASFVGDEGWIGRIGAAAALRPDAWGRDGAPLLGSLGFLLQDSALRRYDQAIACWKALLGFSGIDPALRARVALHCAGLCIHGFGQASEATALLAAIDPAKLSGPDPRLCTLYRGDLALALGAVEEARARYREAGDVVDVRDLGYAVRRRLRLECARSSCARGEWEQALALMGEIEWETPMERLGTETGLIKVRAWLGRKEVPFALSCCRGACSPPSAPIPAAPTCCWRSPTPARLRATTPRPSRRPSSCWPTAPTARRRRAPRTAIRSPCDDHRRHACRPRAMPAPVRARRAPARPLLAGALADGRGGAGAVAAARARTTGSCPSVRRRRRAPRHISGGEGFPPLPLPATPLRRSERKKQPSAPALVGKVVWGEAASFTYDNGMKADLTDGNLCPGDTQQLVEKARSVLGIAYGRQEVDLASFDGDPERLPLLFFSGVRTVSFTPDQIARLRAYVSRGGMIVFDSVAGSPYFTAAAESFCARAFPDEPLRVVPPDHPLYHISFDVDSAAFFRNPPSDHPLLRAVYVGCRCGVLISPYGLGCGLDNHDVPLLKQAVAYDVNTASKLGVNLVAYVVGYAHVGLEEAKPELFGAADEKRPANEFVFAQIRHEGHWDCHPGAAAALLARLVADTSVVASMKRVAVTPGKDDLTPFTVLYLSGLDDFHFSAAAQAALRAFIARGGTLLVDDCLGLATFDRAARREIAALLPGASLTPIPLEHALFAAAVPVRTARLTPAAAKLHPGLTAPLLEGVAVDGDLRVIYSPLDIACGWAGCEHPLARGYEPATATALGIDLVVYGLTH